MSFVLGCIVSAIAVTLSAFGHHALSGMLGPMQSTMFETASRYLTLGGIWLMILGRADVSAISTAAWIWIGVGLVLFCGSLFLFIGWPWPPLMILTPLGGAAMIVGLLVAGLTASRYR